jgi:peptidoglycan/LPS O-acetylase OafA/YrhL
MLENCLRVLTRVTATGKYIPEVDGLRFVAIVWVLAFHINGEFLKENVGKFEIEAQKSLINQVFNTWHFGVQLFFVISGFILGRPFLEHRMKGSPAILMRKYYLRRLTRIEPPLIINLSLCLILLIVVKGASLAELLPHYFSSMAYMHGPIYGGFPLPNFVTWSLEIEAQFYLLMPLIAVLFVRSAAVRRSVLVLSMLFFSSLDYCPWKSHPFISYTLFHQLQFFFGGFLLADWHLKRRDTGRSHTLRADIVAVLVWVSIQFLLLQGGVLQAVLLPFLIPWVFALMFMGRFFTWLLSQRLLSVIGGMCYTIYLYHPFLKSVLKHWTFSFVIGSTYTSNIIFQILLLGMLIVAICVPLFLLFEKPFMRANWPSLAWTTLKNRLGGRPVEEGPPA